MAQATDAVEQQHAEIERLRRENEHLASRNAELEAAESEMDRTAEIEITPDWGLDSIQLPDTEIVAVSDTDNEICA